MIITEDFLLNELTESELIKAWNIYCLESCNDSMIIHSMNEFNDFIKTSDLEPRYLMELVSKNKENQLSMTDQYFISWSLDPYNGTIETFNMCDIRKKCIKKGYINLDDLIEYINDNQNQFLDCENLWDKLSEEEENDFFTGVSNDF